MQNAVMNEEASAENGRLTLTVGDLLMLGVLIIGIVLRFTDLGVQPLTPAEAETAWTAWAFWQPDSLMLAEGSPLYYSLTRLLTPILGFSDGTMRLVPAIFGVALLALPWLWRARIGIIGALVMGLFLAISPLQTHTSRFVGSDATAVFTTLLLLVSVFQYLETQQRNWLLTAVVSLALGLSSTPLFFSSLLTLGVAFGLYRAIGMSLTEKEDELTGADDDDDDSSTSPYTLVISPSDRRVALILFTAVFVSVTTLFLWNPAGIGTAVRMVSSWLAGFNFNNFEAVSSPFLSFFRYQPGLVFLGFLAMGWATWTNHPLGSFCIYWFAAIVILALAQPGVQGLALLMTLPATILVALLANQYLSAVWDLENSLIAIGSFVVLMLMWVNLARFLRIVTFNPDNLVNLWIILFVLVFAGTLIFFLTSVEESIFIQGPLLALILFFAFYGWGTAWWLGHDGFNDTRERWITSATDDDVRVLIPVIDELSRQVSNSSFDLDILSHVESSVLQWYLRDYVNLEFAETIPVTANNAVIITPSTVELSLPNDYLGSDYGLLRPEPQLVTSETMFVDTLRWWLFQDSPTPLPEDRVILWLRSDLTVVE
ncbi:MAG: glycosyltransferase family 39 protein [Chloroflexota bacterium]